MNECVMTPRIQSFLMLQMVVEILNGFGDTDLAEEVRNSIDSLWLRMTDSEQDETEDINETVEDLYSVEKFGD